MRCSRDAYLRVSLEDDVLQSMQKISVEITNWLVWGELGLASAVAGSTCPAWPANSLRCLAHVWSGTVLPVLWPALELSTSRLLWLLPSPAWTAYVSLSLIPLPSACVLQASASAPYGTDVPSKAPSSFTKLPH